MNNFFVQSITPAIVATGATIESKVDRQNAQRTKLTSTITAINMLLARCVVKTVKRRKHKKLASSTAPVLSPEPEMQRDATSISPDVPIVPSPRQCPADCPSPPRRRRNITTANDVVLDAPTEDLAEPSPPRRRSNASPPTLNDTAVTPRRGADSKRTRRQQIPLAQSNANVIGTRVGPSLRPASTPTPTTVPIDSPTTEFLGWRRLHRDELLSLKSGVQYILIIPGYNRYQESKEIKKSREVFYHRVLASLLKANPDDFVGLSKFKKIAKAKEMLQTNNGLRRNDCLVLELPFTVVAFPSQFDYANNNLSLADVQRNIKQDGGIDIDFSDHSPAHRVLLKWKEVNLVQIWTRHYRGDIRPQVQLKHIRGDDFQYCDELSANLEIVRDDTIQTLELALEYEKCKTRMLRRQYRRGMHAHQ